MEMAKASSDAAAAQDAEAPGIPTSVWLVLPCAREIG